MYISDARNLRMMMNLIKDPSKNIQSSAFHVFKVFVANPNKAPQIINILSKNRDKLLRFLDNFHLDKEDEQFEEEKELLVKEIEGLQSPPRNRWPFWSWWILWPILDSPAAHKTQHGAIEQISFSLQQSLREFLVHWTSCQYASLLMILVPVFLLPHLYLLSSYHVFLSDAGCFVFQLQFPAEVLLSDVNMSICLCSVHMSKNYKKMDWTASQDCYLW